VAEIGGSTEHTLTVSVLVPTYRRPALLVQCLDGLARQTLTAHEVLVVVRRDDSESRASIANRSDLPLREVVVDRPGVVAARNAGLDIAAGDIVAFIDDDAIPHPDWLARLVEHYADPAVGAVGGRDQIYHGDVLDTGPLFRRVGILTWYGRFISMHHLGQGPARDVDFLKGVNMSFDRRRNPDVRVDECLRGQGAQVYEETTVCLQIRQRGQRVVYDPEIVVDHHEADRGDNDEREPRLLRPRRDRHHNQAYVVVRYYPVPRAVVHLIYALAIGMEDSPGVALTIRNILRTRRLRGHLVPLLANVQGRFAGLVTALRARDA
jgi:glycosyltransferase involved in cell wall biosynthesis